MGSAVDMLIAAGHTLSDIKEYSVKQIQKFSELFRLRNKVFLCESSISMRAAYHADGKAYKAFIDTASK